MILYESEIKSMASKYQAIDDPYIDNDTARPHPREAQRAPA